MNDVQLPSAGHQATPARTLTQPCILHVCTSCRPTGMPREPKANRPGFTLYQELSDAVDRSPLRERVTVRAAECLSVCPRPCGIALSSPDSWSYLFGDQKATVTETTSSIIDCLAVYLESPDGFMPRKTRPKSLRSSILGRVPPIKEVGECT